MFRAWTGLLAFTTTVALGAVGQDPPRVLVVSAHPDDEIMFAATLYRVTHGLDGVVDLAVITDGSGGFRYAGLSESIYGRELTDEDVARQYLPAIRKRELMAGGSILGIRNYFFLDEFDHGYTENVDTVLTHVWDTATVRSRITEIMMEGQYDFAFVHLPRPDFHAHHKSASLLALEAARNIPAQARPLVLGAFIGAHDDTSLTGFREMTGYPITRVRSRGPHFFFDRTQPLDESGRLNYHIVVNWSIAEHKTQGTMQLLMNAGDVERFWYFEANGPEGFVRATEFFDRLNGHDTSSGQNRDKS